MTSLLESCSQLPIRTLAEGDVLLTEGQSSTEMYVVIDGAFVITSRGAAIAGVGEPGAIFGEVGALCGVPATATVTATGPSRVHVITDPESYLASDPEIVLEIARTLANRLRGLTGYIDDIRAQYGDSSNHLGLLDEVLTKLSLSAQPTVEPGSERDPDPMY